MARKLHPVKGMHDILPEDLMKAEYVKSLFLRVAERYGFLHIQTPTLELAEIYKATSEFPEGKCYSIDDCKGRKMILRSDPDAQFVRLVANHFLYAPKPVKLAFCGSIFRSWNVHRREFTMFSIATFGVGESTADAEILRVIADVVEEVGFPGYRIEFNNLRLFNDIICADKSKPRSEDEVGNILHAVRFAGDAKAVTAILESHYLPTNIIDAVLSLLYCDSDAYNVLDKLGKVFPSLISETKKTLVFEASLSGHGLYNSQFDVSNLHGTGFYSGFTYRLFPKEGPKEIGDGGRYDHMMQQMQGSHMPATGIGLGIERFVELMETNHCSTDFLKKAKSIFVAYADPGLADRCRSTLRLARSSGFIVEEDIASRSFDKAFRYAKSKKFSRIVMIGIPGQEAGIHLKIVNLDDDSANSLVIRDPEELGVILLKC